MLIVAHKPVLVREVVEALAVTPGGRYVDGTLGDGGHAEAILQASAPGGQILGIDADPEAVHRAGMRLEEYRDSVLLVNDNFANLDDICRKADFAPVHGVLLDLGLSSNQLDDDPRGFSFQRDAVLDMRFDPSRGQTAADILNQSSVVDIARMLWEYGEERLSQRIARRIVEARPVTTTLQLARIVEEAVGGRHGRIHPATRTFQALRIAVNRELEVLADVMGKAVDVLGPGGRLVVISYHSLEDRIVKRFMQTEARDCICPPRIPECRCEHRASLRLVNKKVIVPSEAEVRDNPRSRSAKMRVAEKTGERATGAPMTPRFSQN